MPFEEQLTPDTTTIVLVDYAVGFANILRSTDLATHKNNVLGLAKTAKLFDVPLVVTNGLPHLPSGPLYPELLDVLDGHRVIERPGYFDVFSDADVLEAVEATGNKRIVLGGVSTEGCVNQSVLGGLRRGYDMHVVVDATASISKETHDVSIQRMIQAGAVPLTWFALAGEFLGTHQSPYEDRYRDELMNAHVPEMRAGGQAYAAVRALTT